MSNNKPKDAMVGARREDSVLFSLEDLGSSGASKPAASQEEEEVDESGFINLGHASALKGGARSPGGASQDASGFINLGQIGQTMSGDASDQAVAPVDFQVPLAPMGNKENNNSVKIAIAASGVLLVLAVGALLYLILNQDKTPQVQVLPPPVGSESAQGAGKASPPTPGADSQGAMAAQAPAKDDATDEPEEKEPTEAAPDQEEAPAAQEAQAPAADKDKKAAVAKVPTPKEKAAAQQLGQQAPAKEAPAQEEAPKAEPKESQPAKADPGKQDNIDKILGDMGGKKAKEAPAADLPEKLTRNMVKSTLQRYGSKVRGCGGEGRSGNVVVRFTVQPNGAVAGASVAGAKQGTPEGGCVLSAVKSMRFPAFQGPAQTINYPFVLP